MKQGGKKALTSTSALNTKESIRDYKTITSSTSSNFNKVEARLEHGDSIGNDDSSTSIDEKAKGKIKRNSSLISLKSINQNLKAILKISRNEPNASGDVEAAEGNKKKQTNPPVISAPSLRIDDVDIDETKILLNYPQSPQRYPSSASVTPTTTSSPLLQYHEYVPRSVSPSYLSISPSPRRSSTSDILNKKPSSATISVVDSTSKKSIRSNSGSGSALIADHHLAVVQKERRPSTSELLRKARERKGSEGKLGRSISSGNSLSRSGGNRNRRLSMAF